MTIFKRTPVLYSTLFLRPYADHHTANKRFNLSSTYGETNAIRELEDCAVIIDELTKVISHLDYCNVILSGIAQGEINKMQRIQNLCAKIGENMTVLLYNSPYRSEVHWVPIKCRISFKILTFMYNCSEGHASTGVFKRTFVETVHKQLNNK